ERESQKAILIGEEGKALKKVGEIARKSIEQFLARPVYLELWVKVSKDWRKNESFIRRTVYG
ncbi:MAG: KH domain-containing protein, partial [candidate division WOR-3 bacterium]